MAWREFQTVQAMPCSVPGFAPAPYPVTITPLIREVTAKMVVQLSASAAVLFSISAQLIRTAPVEVVATRLQPEIRGLREESLLSENRPTM